jgi:dTMP kinase
MSKTKRFYGKGLPGVDLTALQGTLIVVEGSDGAGRTTQIDMLSDWLQRKGYPTVTVGLKRSELVGEALTEAMQGHTLTPTTMSLFYATDFADQLERVILPALRAGFTVLADRYIYTLMARDLVRGGTVDWLRDLYGFALVPDAVFYITVGPHTLADRNFQKRGFLDYWESGMDIARAGDMYESFLKYQARLHKTFKFLQRDYGFTTLNGMKSVRAVHKEIRDRVEKLLVPDHPSTDKAPASSNKIGLTVPSSGATASLKPETKP